MKLTITHLKAPWPEGAKVGDVLDMPGVPAWALGKCQPAGEDAEVTITTPEAEHGAAEDVPPSTFDREAAEAEAKALGVSFNSRTGDDVLAERIAEAKAAA